MKVLIYDTKRYDRDGLNAANAGRHHLDFIEAQLNEHTAALANGYQAVSIFVNDDASSPALVKLAEAGVKLITLRSTGFNNVNVDAARRLGITVMRVANYSPWSVAEFAVGLLQTLNRKIHRAYNRTRDGNFELDGLMGFDFHGRCVGVIGSGKIGRVFATIMRGFRCEVLGFDQVQSDAFIAAGGAYAGIDELYARADIVSLHCPLTAETHHIVNRNSLAAMKPGSLLVNTSRGGLIDTEAAIEALKSGQLGGLAIDVYEQEEEIFFQDLSSEIITDDLIQRLVSFPNVIVTGHQSFFTREAISTIVATTLESIADFEAGRPLRNEVRA